MKDDLKWGIALGLRMAVIYTIVGVGIVLIGGGSDQLALLLAAVYFGAGVLSGALLGLFKRWAVRSRALAMLLGVIIALPATFLFALLSVEEFVLDDRVAFVTLATAVW
ncbi:MAG: hypothetical protein ACOC5M_03525, partial [Chloroflexota bacterium]